MGSLDFGIPVRETLINLTLDHSCDRDRKENRVTHEDTFAVGSSLPLYTSQMQDTNSISGTHSVQETGSAHPQLTHRFNWNFQRRSATP